MPNCKWCGSRQPNKNLLNKHESTCEWKEKKEEWNKRVSDNKGKTFWYVDSFKYEIKPCILSDSYLMIIFINEDNSLCNYSQSFKEENLFETKVDAEKRLEYLDNLYHKTFKHVPYMKEPMLTKYLQKLIYIENSITEQLKDFPNFIGIDFCNVSANGVQIRGHHEQIKRYTYGKQPTIKYDFSNCEEVINEFVEMWKQIDNPTSVRGELAFIADGEIYGWD